MLMLQLAGPADKNYKMRSEGQGKDLTYQGDEDNEQYNYHEI